jgi:hypothetical protein
MTAETKVPTLFDLEDMAGALESRLIILEMAMAGRERAPRDPDHERRAIADYIAGLSDLAAAPAASPRRWRDPAGNRNLPRATLSYAGAAPA